MTDPKREEVFKEFKNTAVCCVSTYAATKIRNRMMHFAVSPDFKFYLSSIKTDPKTKQILLRSEVSLLVYIPGDTFSEDKEIEITGYARLVKDKDKKEKAVQLMLNRSPVVAQLSQSGNIDMLSFIEVIPIQIKFRAVRDILQGISPKVINFEHRQLLSSDWEKFKKKVNAWIIETRYPFLAITIIPVFFGMAIALAKRNVFNPFYFILTLVGAIFLHLGTNIINDYFDHKSGNDEINREFVRPFSGGSRMIQLGLLTSMEVLSGAIIFFIMGILIGLYLVYQCGLPLLFLGLAGVISGFFYTAPVFNWVSKGIGELLVGLNFGVLITIGSYYVQTKTFSPEVFWASLPLGILVSAILWINEIPDYNADKEVGKDTLVVRMGRKRAAKIFGYILLNSYVLLIIGIILGYLPAIMLFGLVSLPFAIQSIIYANKFYSSPFDMAVGNGFTVLCFNISGIVFILSYLWISIEKLYLLPILFLSLIYILWNYNTIKVQKETFLKLKEIT